MKGVKMIKFKKIALMMILTLLICLTGCKKIPFNTRVITDNYEFNEEFLKNNLTYGAYTDHGCIEDESYSRELIIVIDSQEKLTNTFNKFDKVDFSKEIIIIRGITTPAHPKYKIKFVELKNKELKIKFKIISKKRNPPDASLPLTKWMVVRMDAVEFDKVSFTYK